jgi:hypothetical protein
LTKAVLQYMCFDVYVYNITGKFDDLLKKLQSEMVCKPSTRPWTKLN